MIKALQDCICKAKAAAKDALAKACDALAKACSADAKADAIQAKLDAQTRFVYRLTPPAEPGLNYRFWQVAAGPNLDPLEWAGPTDPVSGFPLPTAAPADNTGISNASNIRDSVEVGYAARYGIIDGWIFLPDGTTTIRDNNAQTGELGMVLLGDCCGGGLEEQPGGNHANVTSTADRTLLDPTPITGGWYYIYNPQSDNGAFQGLDLEYSTDGGTIWQDVTVMQPTKPQPESQEIGFCDPIPAGWQLEPIEECCQPEWQAAGGIDEAAVLALINAQDHDDPDPATAAPLASQDGCPGLRAANVGTSLDYARADHRHPITRLPNPGDVLPTFAGSAGAVMNLAQILDRWSDEESYAWMWRCRVVTNGANGWDIITVPTLPGFQQPQITLEGTYRQIGNPNADDGVRGAMPDAPYMGMEAAHWSSTRRIYIAQFNDKPTPATYWVHIRARYICN